MYAQIATHPDLLYAISTLSKSASNPRNIHWNALTHVLCYIRGTLDFRITYRGKYKDLARIGYIDTDYTGCYKFILIFKCETAKIIFY